MASPIIKSTQYTYDAKLFEENAPLIKPRETVIKRAFIDYSIPERVRLGMLPPDALYYYEMMKAKEEEMAAEAAAKAEQEKTEAEFASTIGERMNESSDTFWANDTSERTLISEEEFAMFLRQNSIDLGGVQSIADGYF